MIPAVSDPLIRRIGETTDFRVLTARDIRRIMACRFDSADIARAYGVSEASVWNRMVHDDRAPRF